MDKQIPNRVLFYLNLFNTAFSLGAVDSAFQNYELRVTKFWKRQSN